jgi:protein N-terminal methyltransferase
MAAQPAITDDGDVAGLPSTDESVLPDALIQRDEGIKYWNSIESDVNGMLGGVPSVKGFSGLSKVDLQGSRNFLAKLGIGSKDGLHRLNSALEGGAG